MRSDYPLRPLPQDVIDFYRSSLLLKHGFKTNALCALSALTLPADGDIRKHNELHLPWQNSCFKMHGLTYARILQNNHTNSSISYYFGGPDFHNRAAAQRSSVHGPGVPTRIFDITRKSLQQHNHLVRELIALRDTPSDDAAISFHTADPDAPQACNREFFTVTSFPPSAMPGPRQYVYFKNSTVENTQAQFVESLDPLYEPLAYPLVFFHAERGFTPPVERRGNSLTLAQYSIARIALPERLEDGTYLWYMNENSDRIPCSRLDTMPWLSQQYALDSFSRIREQRLQHVRNNQQLINRRPAVRNEDAAENADGTQQGRHVRIPKSFPSSPKFLSNKVLDALETVRFCGRPLTFLTFTTNPKWQELLEMLPAGCTAYDCPAITNRVFKMKLDAFLTELKCGSLWSMTLVSENSSTNPAERVWTYSLRRSDMPNTVPGYMV